jgi:hypothetical protein
VGNSKIKICPIPIWNSDIRMTYMFFPGNNGQNIIDAGLEFEGRGIHSSKTTAKLTWTS